MRNEANLQKTCLTLSTHQEESYADKYKQHPFEKRSQSSGAAKETPCAITTSAVAMTAEVFCETKPIPFPGLRLLRHYAPRNDMDEHPQAGVRNKANLRVSASWAEGYEEDGGRAGVGIGGGSR
jgi:hypothetical protein